MYSNHGSEACGVNKLTLLQSFEVGVSLSQVLVDSKLL
jgi:hypothetical protein